MYKKGLYLVALFFILQNSLVAYSTNPKDFVNELLNDTISKLTDTSLNKDQKASFVEKVALDNVDINALGLYTLGVLRKSSSEEDISNYQKSFEKYFLKNLTTRLVDYSSSKFELLFMFDLYNVYKSRFGIEIDAFEDYDRNYIRNLSAGLDIAGNFYKYNFEEFPKVNGLAL